MILNQYNSAGLKGLNDLKTRARYKILSADKNLINSELKHSAFEG